MTTELMEREETQSGLQEMNASGSAAFAKALVTSAFIVGMERPRDWDKVEKEILRVCRRHRWAEAASYTLIRRDKGKIKKITTYGIEGVKAAIQAMQNIMVTSDIVAETPTSRTQVVRVTDVERNITYARTNTIPKTMDRHERQKGLKLIGERENSKGETIYTYEITEDELRKETNRNESLAISALGRKLIPIDIHEAMVEAIEQAKREAIRKDPKGTLANLIESYDALNIGTKDLESLLGHSLDIEQMSEDELSMLRGIYSAILKGESSWAEVSKTTRLKETERAEINLDDVTDVTDDRKAEEEAQKEAAPPEPPKEDPPSPEPQPAQAPAEEKPSAPEPARKGKKAAPRNCAEADSRFRIWLEEQKAPNEAFEHLVRLYLEHWGVSDPSKLQDRETERFTKWLEKTAISELKAEGLIQ